MNILQVYVDFAEAMKELNDAEKGRLFMAMLLYAGSGTEPDFRGNEKVLWPVAKMNIDRQIKSYNRRCVANKKNISSRYESIPTYTNRNESYQDKDKDKDKDIVSLKSIAHSQEDQELERMIEGLHLDLYPSEDRRLVDAIESTIRLMYFSGDGIRVNGRHVSQRVVREHLSALTTDCVDYIIARLEDQLPEDKVTNGQAYLMSCIYNAPVDCVVNEKRARR